MVGAAHHHAHRVSEHLVVRIIVIERLGRPHGGPEVIGLEPQHQFEDVRIGLGVDPAELGFRPAAERRVLVIDEEAAILDARMVGARAGDQIKRRALRDRHVGPPDPGRHAHPLRQVIGPEDGAPPVGADDDEGALDPWSGSLDDNLAVAFPLSHQILERELAALHQRVDRRTLAQLPQNDRRTSRLGECR